MLGLKAKASLLFFVSVGIFTGIVVFGNTVASKKIDTVPEKQDLISNAQTKDSLQNVIGESKPLPADPPTETPTITVSADASTNLTGNLAAFIGKMIVDKNPDGPQNGNMNAVDANTIADEAMAQSINTLDLSGFYPILSSSELTIGPNDTWRENVRTALQDRISMLKQKKPGESFKDDAKTALLAYEAVIASLYKITTPREYITEQQQLLSLLSGERYAFQSIADYESDPIRGIVALRILPELESQLQKIESQL